jgi:hypothetical protein
MRNTFRVAPVPVLLAQVLAVLAAPRCFAQVRGTVELSPIVGMYLPSAQLPPVPPDPVCFVKGIPHPYGLRCTPSVQRQSSVVALGASVATWVNRRIAIDGSVRYAPSSVPGECGGPAGVVASDVRFLVSTRGAGVRCGVRGAASGDTGPAQGAPRPVLARGGKHRRVRGPQMIRDG